MSPTFDGNFSTRICLHSVNFCSEWTDCKKCWKVSLCYGLNAAIGLHSIAGLNIAVIDMLKRLGPFINLMLAHYLLGFDSKLNFTTTGIYMSAAGCVIGALGNGALTKTSTESDELAFLYLETLG